MMMAVKTVTFEGLQLMVRFQLLPLYFSNRPDFDMTLLTLPDIARRWLPTQFKMTSIETGSGKTY